ncbi:hypothetical protein FRC04_003845 [Tulasnella sp. 424]|nr:hypothetical protein FRC04_003845 [Tulasnella sp. 424]KAG8975343.1 hypothetical protein FRC05_005902 [Tulasnella sp. 425]
MATNTRSKGKNAPPGAFPATSSSSKPTGKSSSRHGDPSSSSSLPSSSSNTPATLSDVERITSTIRNVNLNGTTSSSALYVVSDSEDDQDAQYGGQSQHGGSSKGKGGSGNTNNNNGRKHRRRKSIVRSSGPADELGLLVEELQAASGGSTARPKGKGKGRADNSHHQPQQQQQPQHHHQDTPTARLVMKPPRSPDKGTSSASAFNSRKDATPSVIEMQHSYSSDSEARYDKSKIAKLEREIAALKRQLASPHRSASHAKPHLQADMERLRKEVADQAAEIHSLKTKNNEAQSKLSAVEEALMCQICAGVMHKPYALSPCGHVCCLTCLQEWFQSQRDNEDEDGGSRNRKTCPHCRAKIRSRPVQVFVVKAVVEALGIEPEEESAPLPGSAPTASAVSAVSDDPWHGIFADADEYGEDDEEVEDYYIGHDEDDLDVCEACGADFDLDGYCVGCGAPADFGYSDEEEDEEDAASDGGPGSSPSSDEEVVWQDPMGSDIEYEEDDPGHAITEEDPDNWTLPRPAPPMHDLSREEHNHLNYQEFALCSRGVPFDMIHKYRMQYDSTRGISLQAEHQFSASVFLRFATTAIRRTRTVWVGWNLLGIDEMDVDGTAYVNGILRDMRDRPYRWMEVPTTGGGISVYRLVRKLGPEDVDYGSDVDVSEPVI